MILRRAPGSQSLRGAAQKMGVDPGDPFANLEGRARDQGKHLSRFHGDPENAPAAYNAGPRAGYSRNWAAAEMASAGSPKSPKTAICLKGPEVRYRETLLCRRASRD